MDDKPISLSMKDWLIRRLAVKMMITEKTLETVINHQFQSANEALLNNKSVEISGFGKFFFNQKKAEKRMETLKKTQQTLLNILASPETTEQKRVSTEQKLQFTLSNMEALKPKLHEN
jgi:nucleoid DNA-binding protein